MKKTCLLVIDIQNDYFPGGKMELDRSEAAGLAAGRLLSSFRQKGMPIVYMQHLSTRPGATFFIPETAGVEIHESVTPAAGETVITKHFPNSFRDTNLLEHLRALGAERLVVAGMMSHMCVDASIRAAVDHGFECWIAADACATRQLVFEGREVAAADVHASFMAALNGVYGRVMSAESVIAGLDTA